MASVEIGGGFAVEQAEGLAALGAGAAEAATFTRSGRRRGWLVRRMLLAADVVGLAVAFSAVESMFGLGGSHDNRVGLLTEFVLFFATLPGWVAVIHLYGLYRHDEERAHHSTVDDLVGVAQVLTLGAWLFFIAAWISQLADPHLAKLVSFWVLAVLSVTLARAFARALARRSPAFVQHAVIVGAGSVGQMIAQKLLLHPEYGVEVVGFVDENPRERLADVAHVPLLGKPDELPELVGELAIERVIVSFSGDRHQELVELVRSLKGLNVQIDIVPRLFEIVGRRAELRAIEGVPLVGLRPFRLSRVAQMLKRVTDMILVLLAIVLLSPLVAVVALLIKLDSHGPVLFRQLRMGRGNRAFTIYKFRTMTVDAEDRKQELSHLNMHLRDGGDPRMFKIPDDPRITRFGRILRRYSLDELPQLLNVLRGEMSLVGPRPLILDEDRYVDEWARKRLDLKPGVTGLWQVLGRSGIPFEEMVKLDYLYVTEWSLCNDFKLMLRTIPILFRTRAAH